MTIMILIEHPFENNTVEDQHQLSKLLHSDLVWHIQVTELCAIKWKGLSITKSLVEILVIWLLRYKAVSQGSAAYLKCS